MRTVIVVASCIILLFFLLEKSGALLAVHYTVLEGPIKIAKTRWEWHPEKLTSFLKRLPQKWHNRFLKKGTSITAKAKPQKPTHRLVLKNGTLLRGNVVLNSEKGVLFYSEGGEVFFDRDEISSLETE